MSYIVEWLEPATRGLERIYLFLAGKDEEAARAAIRAIREKAILLENFPNAGRPADDLEPEHRELLVPFGISGYVLLYRIEKDVVYILAIRHQREVGY